MFKLSDEVQEAIAARRPVVALESTVIAHGLPRPHNLELGLRLESIVREAGCIPATTGVIDGKAMVGLGSSGIERMAMDPDVAKASTRELGVMIAAGRSAGTTVASTGHLAHRAGIRVMATGGIGGVHRGYPPDISADLLMLQQTPLICVCAGAKSILDLPATREALETLGILVLGWKTDELPAFFTPRSALSVDALVDSALDVTRIHTAKATVGDGTGTLVCAPPPERDEASVQRIEQAIQDALEESLGQRLKGKEITPFLLAEVTRRSGGESLRANIALLENNARIASLIAREASDAQS